MNAGDQLFRNAFRGTAKMYAADDKVLSWSKALLVSLLVRVPGMQPACSDPAPLVCQRDCSGKGRRRSRRMPLSTALLCHAFVSCRAVERTGS